MSCKHDGEQRWTRLGKSPDLRHNVYEVQCAACPASWLHTGQPPGLAAALADANLTMPRLDPEKRETPEP